MGRTLYDILHVPLTANPEAIEVSYHRLRDALEHRAEAGDEDARIHLIAVREAWRTLSDATRRRSYDASLELREKANAVGNLPTEEPAEDVPTKLQFETSTVIKGALVLIGLVIAGYIVVSDRQDEAQRLDRIRATESRQHAIEMEKLAIERARAEAAAAEEAKRLELRKQQLDQAARAQAASEERTREYAQKQQAREQAHAESIAAAQRAEKERSAEIMRISQEAKERTERENRLRQEREQLRRICRERYGREDC